jgi:hypothetical protein
LLFKFSFELIGGIMCGDRSFSFVSFLCNLHNPKGYHDRLPEIGHALNCSILML